MVQVPHSLVEDTETLISPLVSSMKRKRENGGSAQTGSLLRKKSKYSPGGSKIHADTPPGVAAASGNTGGSSALGSGDASARGSCELPTIYTSGGEDSDGGGASAAKASPSIQFSPFNRVNLIPAKEEYDEYKDGLPFQDPEVKQLF